MKLKSTLWALALAFAAVSCSDDLGSPNNGNENPDGNKSSTYMKVTVNAGVVTRAGVSEIPPTGGEDGDGNEVGLVNEYRITDVTVILFKNMKDDINDTPNDTEFKPTSKIVGVGYATTTGAMTPGEDDWHSRSATVQVVARDDEDFDGNTYGIIAVTNWGSDQLKDKIKSYNLDATQLANLLVEKTYEEATAINRNFIMSSHIKKPQDNKDIVTLEANATPETAPNATVHVERLAAKVRIKPTNAEGVTNYIYPIKVEGNATAKVRLDNVVLVNKLKTGSYLLKRVTSDITEGNAIPAINSDSWLGDENETTATVLESTVYPGKNYVIDPWTRTKTVDGSGKIVASVAAEINNAGKPIMIADKDATAPTLDYDNKYDGTLAFSVLWEGTESRAGLKSSAKQLSGAHNNNQSIIVDYTMENTTSVVASKNGYSTGALFKAVYLLKQWSAVTKKTIEGQEKEVVEPVDVNYEGVAFDNIDQSTTGQTFYVYQGNIYKDFAAIFNEFVWEKQKSLEGKTEKIYSYSDFTSENIQNIKMADFEESYLYENTASDPIGYIPYLRNIIENAKKSGPLGDKNFQGGNDINKYIESSKAATYPETKTEPKTEEKTYTAYVNVKEYTDGVTYYPYWIRHANNGKPTEMGIMEFGIVRNNVYDMTVKEIRGLGLSGIDKPEPDKDDETKDYYFNVEINVKNWVIRNNGNIIL